MEYKMIRDNYTHYFSIGLSITHKLCLVLDQ